MNCCVVCFEIKPVSEFAKNKKMRNGHINRCNTCTAKRVRKRRRLNADRINNSMKIWREKNPDKMKKYREKNKEYARQYNKEYTSTESFKLKMKKWRLENKEKTKESRSKHYVLYREKILDRIKEKYDPAISRKRSADYRCKNPEKIIKARGIHYQINKHKISATNLKKRYEDYAEIKKLEMLLTKEIRNAK